MRKWQVEWLGGGRIYGGTPSSRRRLTKRIIWRSFALVLSTHRRVSRRFGYLATRRVEVRFAAVLRYEVLSHQ